MCDLCVAAKGARFGITEAKVGRGFPWAAPLGHMIPQRIMMEIVLTGKPISAQRAYEIGLVNRLAEPDQLMPAALAGEMTGTVKEVDMEKHMIVLEDGMSVTNNMDVKLDGVMTGDKAKIMTDDKNMGTMGEKMN